MSRSSAAAWSVSRPRSRLPSAGSVCVLEARNRARARHQHAQQRRHSRRPLLPGRVAESDAVRRRARSAVRVLRGSTTCRIVRCGKLVVAARRPTSSASSSGCMPRALANGVPRASIVDRAFIRGARAACPGATPALWSPDTGIVEAEALGQDARAPLPRARRRAAGRQPTRRRAAARAMASSW